MDDDSPDPTERMMAGWTSPVYVFYHPKPTIGYKNGREYIEFQFQAKGCKHTICCFLDKKDAGSTSNLRKHVKHCKSWGDAGQKLLKKVAGATSMEEARKVTTTYSCSGDITVAFKMKGNKTVTYRAMQHTKAKSK